MSKLFNSVQFGKPKRNKFDLSHEKKMSLKMGDMVPIMVQEVIPGDGFRVNSEVFMRLQPLVAPMMHRVRVQIDHFFVPYRLVWDNWQTFITGGKDGLQNPVHPRIQLGDFNKTDFAKGTLADYMGIPTVDPVVTVTNSLYCSALPFRAYQLIYNEYYRDQNLQEEIVINKGDGQETAQQSQILMTMRKRAWEKDYFTSSLPFAQKGAPTVIPGEATYLVPSTAQLSTGGDPTVGDIKVGGGGGGVLQDANSAPIVIENVDDVTITVSALRVAVRVQEYLERMARAGSRYIETILSFFGVLSSDARLQRPEYMGGSQQPIVISEVLSTFQAADDTGYPQGTMKGHGVSAGSMHGFKKSKFEEHGVIISIMSVLPRTAYQQGLEKFWTRDDRFEYPWPIFAQLGEQEVRQDELYHNWIGADGSNRVTFGYQSRYAECKFKPSTVHGDFRENLDYWHMGRIFTAPPVLNASFIESDPTKRVFAVEDANEDELLCQIFHRVDALRPLPYFNNPTI